MDYNYYFMIDYGLPLLGIIITFIAQIFIKISYQKYKNVPTTKKNTGYETARQILDANGLENVKINKVPGELTDYFGLYLLLAILLFQLVTLPVEFNASSRAGKELKRLNILNDYESGDSKTMLRAAAFTYVASLMSSLLQILRLALIVIGRDDN